MQKFNGLYDKYVSCVYMILKKNVCRSLYGGLFAGLQRQMCFASVRLGLYDSVKTFYSEVGGATTGTT